MGAHVCEYGKKHKMCRCPKTHQIKCDTPERHRIPAESTPVAEFQIGNGWGKGPVLYQKSSEGYPQNDYSINHLTRADLQNFADWMITLPENLYRPIAPYQRIIEQHLLNNN